MYVLRTIRLSYTGGFPRVWVGQRMDADLWRLMGTARWILGFTEGSWGRLHAEDGKPDQRKHRGCVWQGRTGESYLEGTVPVRSVTRCLVYNVSREGYSPGVSACGTGDEVELSYSGEDPLSYVGWLASGGVWVC